jgi:hypothetical protein
VGRGEVNPPWTSIAGGWGLAFVDKPEGYMSDVGVSVMRSTARQVFEESRPRDDDLRGYACMERNGMEWIEIDLMYFGGEEKHVVCAL